MYYPYFRGKQYELITIRETAPLLSESNFIPIIEPVKESLGGLQKALDAVIQAEGKAIVIVNPFHGEHSQNGESISELLRQSFESSNIYVGILLHDKMTVSEAVECCNRHSAHSIALIHSSFTEGRDLCEALGDRIDNMHHIFLDCGKLYRRHFPQGTRVLIKDGFQRRRNKDHPPIEAFSDLHATFKEEGMNGFGDFLIVGDDFSEGGGPAYAVAIHLTFIDGDKDDAMYIYHFISRRQNTPTDPAGKFMEALEQMIEVLDKPDSKIFRTAAIQEFRTLSERKHFPGLGYLKKLSMQHHIQTLAQYFATGQ